MAPIDTKPLMPTMTDMSNNIVAAPLNNLDEWEEDLKVRYPEPGGPAFNAIDPEKKKEQFRDYAKNARPSVREFYRQNHTHQTFDFVQQKRQHFLGLNNRKMNVWEAIEYLNTLVDDSDPDTDLSQLEHLLQTSEQIRKDGQPRWFILTGLIHDLGKILCLWGEPQWCVVGDTYPLGCAFSDKIVFPEFFDQNADKTNPRFNTRLGVYEEGCGLDKVMMSWGHDEYLYNVVKNHLPDEALYMIRYHSFYPAHREGEYDYLMNDKDRAMFEWVKKFNPYDLYTKNQAKPNVKELRPFYEDLINEYLPGQLRW
jgi:inositol oxygenase